MEVVAIIATVILLATLLTLVFSFAAYFVTRAKKILASRSKAVTPDKNQASTTRIFFERYLPSDMSEEPSKAGGKEREEQWM